MSAANSLRSAIAKVNQTAPEQITDNFAAAVGRQLESRAIAKVPGLPEAPQPQWFELAIEYNRLTDETAARHRAQLEADEEAQRVPPPTTEVVAQALARAQAKAVKAIPLNSDGILTAVLDALR